MPSVRNVTASAVSMLPSTSSGGHTFSVGQDAPRIFRKLCPSLVSDTCVRHLCPPLVSATCVRHLCPPLVSDTCVRHLCPPLVSDTCVRHLCPTHPNEFAVSLRPTLTLVFYLRPVCSPSCVLVMVCITIYRTADNGRSPTGASSWLNVNLLLNKINCICCIIGTQLTGVTLFINLLAPEFYI